ncbi:hypothetical protein E2562_029825 [Oryza meyeriana var. granulata]|uniref:Uncharacterized protein n=1 Tax=Oryza meyeriana var. granulata TaxID=110450 RepID=A0A6G1CUK8_9ORYZ|nr:hypothetical protein E2562_029825 [Oryza meyeriana var. granulata]
MSLEYKYNGISKSTLDCSPTRHTTVQECNRAAQVMLLRDAKHHEAPRRTLHRAVQPVSGRDRTVSARLRGGVQAMRGWDWTLG